MTRIGKAFRKQTDQTSLFIKNWEMVIKNKFAIIILHKNGDI